MRMEYHLRQSTSPQFHYWQLGMLSYDRIYMVVDKPVTIIISLTPHHKSAYTTTIIFLREHLCNRLDQMLYKDCKSRHNHIYRWGFQTCYSTVIRGFWSLLFTKVMLVISGYVISIASSSKATLAFHLSLREESGRWCLVESDRHKSLSCLEQENILFQWDQLKPGKWPLAERGPQTPLFYQS